MILPELLSLLTTSTDFKVGGSTGAATPIYLGRLPKGSEDTAVALYEAGGAGPAFIYGALSHERPSIQVLSRSTSYPTGRLNAQLVHNILASVTNSTLSGVSYTSITPLQAPFDVGEDTNGRHLLSCNYSVEKATT